MESRRPALEQSQFDESQLPAADPDIENAEPTVDRTAVVESRKETIDVSADIRAQIEALEKHLKRGIVCLVCYTTAGAALVSSKMPELSIDWRFQQWRSSVADSLNPEANKVYEKNKRLITAIFGETPTAHIEFGAFHSSIDQQEPREYPELIGFGDEKDLHQNYFLTEEYHQFPKNWIKGELDSIEFLTNQPTKIVNGIHMRTMGQVESHKISKPTMALFPREPGARAPDYCHEAMLHELGHANDWENDMDLTLVERQELLLEAYDRMMAPDHYSADGWDYIESYLDGTREGLYKATGEYWAVICANFFNDPKVFKEKFPHDFDLVRKYVQKNDPGYDVHERKSLFDPYTGEFRSDIEIDVTLEKYLRKIGRYDDIVEERKKAQK